MICKNLLHNLNLALDGTLKPCAYFKGDLDCYSYNMLDLHNHPQYQKIINDQLQGKKNIECQHCWNLEEQDKFSPRQGAGFSLETICSVRSLELDLDHYCNLKCITCNEQHSSSILLEKQSHNLEIKSFKISPTYTHMNFVYYLLPKLSEIRISNTGEPLQSSRLVLLLRKIKSLNPSIKVTVNTNATKLESHIKQELRELTNLCIEISVDGIGTVNDFIRWGSNWQEVNSIIDQLNEFNSRLRCVISPLNVLDLDNILVYAQTKNLPIDFYLADWHYSFEVIKPELEHSILTVANQYPKLSNLVRELLANSYSENRHREFVNFVQNLAKRRNIDIDQYLPFWSKIA